MSAAGTGSCSDTTQKFLAYLKAEAAVGTAIPAGSTVVQANGVAELAGTTDACYAIWGATDGGCCPVAALNTYFAARQAPIKAAWDSFVAGAVVVNGILAKLKAMVATRATALTDLTTARTASATLFAGLSAEQATTIAEKINVFAAEVGAFKTEAKACFDALMMYRGAAFCYGCSAVTTHKAFFDATTGSILIKQSTRDLIATKCIKPWNFMFALGGATQALAILNKQRLSTAAAAVTQIDTYYAGVTAVELYTAVMACPNSTLAAAGATTGCLQASIDTIIVANFNLFMAEKSANANNMVATLASSQPARRVLTILATTAAEVRIAADTSAGADLAVTVTSPTYSAGSIVLTTLPDAPAAPGSPPGSGTTTSAGNIFAMTAIATLAAFVLTLN